jgi:hypothetical protein
MLLDRPFLADCSCTGVSAFRRATATPQIPSPKADLVPEKPTQSGLSNRWLSMPRHVPCNHILYSQYPSVDWQRNIQVDLASV